jgi:hypothetical protein
MQQTLFTDEDIDAFWAEAPRRASIDTARITCRVCERPAEQPIDTAGLLCNECRADLDATEAHIRGVLERAQLAFLTARDRHQANVAHADVATQMRYRKVQDALGAAHEGTVGAGSVRRRYEEALLREDSLGVLLRERDAVEASALEYARLAAWAERGLEEVRAVRS